MPYFQQLSNDIYRDISKGQLISADMHFYYYLLTKGGHGSPILLPEKRMAKDLNVSVGKIQLAIRRLKITGHIERTKTTKGYSTRLLTIINRKI